MIKYECELETTTSGFSIYCKEKGLELKEVKLIKDVPAFVGPDMKRYGPYKPGDIAKVSNTIAELLTHQKLAVKN